MPAPLDPEAIKALPLRPCVGIMLIDDAGRVFAAQRRDASAPAWQMPQGGIDPGEDPRVAALRELHEEIAVGPDRVEVLAETEDWLSYDLPPEIVPKVWGGKFRGQTQKWFLLRFLGEDSQIDLQTASPEFSDWRWMGASELLAGIVPFKRQTYEQVVAAFRPWLAE